MSQWGKEEQSRWQSLCRGLEVAERAWHFQYNVTGGNKFKGACEIEVSRGRTAEGSQRGLGS